MFQYRVFLILTLKSLFAIALFSAAACAQSDSFSNGAGKNRSVVIIESATGEHRFNVEMADTDETRRLGLMYRENMAADAGMLFDFGEPQAISMWMKNTLIPLDMAFIDEKGVIKRIAANTTPRSLESVRSGALVISVLEVNGGVFAELGVKEGDQVRHPIFSQD